MQPVSRLRWVSGSRLKCPAFFAAGWEDGGRSLCATYVHDLGLSWMGRDLPTARWFASRLVGVSWLRRGLCALLEG